MNSALITSSSGKAIQEIAVPGLVNVLLQHEVKSTSAAFQWLGPRINPAEWAKMMAFFEWTYEKEKSEAQVRWYVHPEQGWRCWAFPQKGGTGMTTKELPEAKESAEQRQQFPGSSGWLYYMTVHHHCSSSAFQSGVDHADEKDVDGIHMTIGWLNKPQRDIHVRMYMKQHTFQPRMQFFWDVGEVVKAKAKEVEDLFKLEVDLNKVALSQMSQSSALLWAQAGLQPPAEAFPELWKSNYIVDRPQWPPQRGPITQGDSVYQPGIQGQGGFYHNCEFCNCWTNHWPEDCPDNPKKKGATGLESNTESLLGKSNGGKEEEVNGAKLSTIYDYICAQLAIMGYTDDDIDEVMKSVLDYPEAEAVEVILSELFKSEGISRAELFDYHQHIKEQGIQESKKSEEDDRKEYIEENKGVQDPNPNTIQYGWESGGYGGME